MLASPICHADFDDLFRLNQDPDVAKTMAGTRSAAETREFIRSAAEHWERHGYGFWMFRDRPDGRFIGRGGLHHVEIDKKPDIEIAYAVMKEFWHRGFATEMARATLHVATALGLDDIVAFTLPTNLDSRSVMEKVGFHYEREITWSNLPHVLYRKAI
jgi:ribosomal-protein-alanine N-acetyltransferase